jgi:glutaredoxin 3
VSADRRIVVGRPAHQGGGMAQVVVYTRPFCIWCFRAKRLLRRHGVAFEERDARDTATRVLLFERTGRKTVPQIFFDHASVGGFEDLRALIDRGGFASIQQQA